MPKTRDELEFNKLEKELSILTHEDDLNRTPFYKRPKAVLESVGAAVTAGGWLLAMLGLFLSYRQYSLEVEKWSAEVAEAQIEAGVQRQRANTAVAIADENKRSLTVATRELSSERQELARQTELVKSATKETSLHKEHYEEALSREAILGDRTAKMQATNERMGRELMQFRNQEMGKIIQLQEQLRKAERKAAFGDLQMRDLKKLNLRNPDFRSILERWREN